MKHKVKKDNLTDLVDEIKPQTQPTPSSDVSEPTAPKITAPEVPPTMSDYEVLLPDGTVVTLSQVQKSMSGITMSRVDKPPKSRIRVIKESGDEYVQIIIEEQTEYISPKLKVIKK